MIRTPPRLKKSTPKRRRTSYKKPSLYRSIQPNAIVKTRCGFPDTLQTTVRYQETLTLSSTAGALYGYVYNLNGLFDPNQSGTGHQPLYFDQLMGIYNHYIVIGSRITCTFTAWDNPCPVNVTLSPNDDSTIAPASFTAIAEQSSATMGVVSPAVGPVKLFLNWSMKKAYGPNPPTNLLRGNATVNPTETSCATIAVQSSDTVSTTVTTVTVQISYITQFTELRDIGGS